MNLAIIHYEQKDEKSTPHIYVEYKTNDFLRVLLAEYDKVKDVTRAFERTCHELRRKSGTL
jgi:hypothetical protein